MRATILTLVLHTTVILTAWPRQAVADEGAPSPETEQVPSDEDLSNGPADPGWALEAAILGFSAAGVTLGLGIAADAWMGDEPEAGPLALELGGVVAIGAVNPVVFMGGRSARLGADVEGCFGCRTAAWVLFATHAAAAVATITLHFAMDDPVPHGVVGGMMGLGSASNLLFAVDALMAHDQASSAAAAASTSSSEPGGVAVAPVLAPLAGRDGIEGGVVGIALIQ